MIRIDGEFYYSVIDENSNSDGYGGTNDPIYRRDTDEKIANIYGSEIFGEEHEEYIKKVLKKFDNEVIVLGFLKGCPTHPEAFFNDSKYENHKYYQKIKIFYEKNLELLNMLTSLNEG